MQPMPVTNVQPLLYQNIKKSTVVHFSMLKMLYSFFNWSHLFFIIPMSIILTIEGQPAGQVAAWGISIYFILLINNYLNVLVNQRNTVFALVASVVLGSAALQYFGIFDITPYTQVFFLALFNHSWLIIPVFALLLIIYYSAFSHFRTRMYLDAGLAKKSERTISISENYFNRFGKLGLILRNDVALIPWPVVGPQRMDVARHPGPEGTRPLRRRSAMRPLLPLARPLVPAAADPPGPWALLVR